MRDVAWLAAQMSSWAAALADVADIETAREDGIVRWRFASRGAHPLPVEIAVGGDAIEVALADWRQSFAVDEEGPEEAAELVAAGLFGRARAQLELVGDDWVRFDLQFRAREGWRSFAVLRRRRLAAWLALGRRAAIVHLANELAPPPELEIGEPWRLPTAPWIGLLPEPAGESPARALVVDGEIDLHPFAPKEVAAVVRAYIDACVEQGVFELRIVHGKGIGHLRRTVHALLAKDPRVASYRLGGHGEGSWGATIVTLARP